MTDTLTESGSVPPVPGVWRLGWLLFMQPLQLHKLFRAWGIDGDPSLLSLRQRARFDDLTLRRLLARFAVWLFVIGPVIAILIAVAINYLATPILWSHVARTVAIGIAVGVVYSLTFNTASGVAYGFMFGVAVVAGRGIMTAGFFADVNLGVTAGLGFGVGLGVAMGVVGSIEKGIEKGVAAGVAVGVASGVSIGIVVSFVNEAASVAWSVAFCISFAVVRFRLPIYFIEAPLQWFLLHRFLRGENTAPPLLFRYHDLIHLPLPGLRRYLVELGRREPGSAQQLIAETASTVGQKRPAQAALVELQALTLEDAARSRSYSRVAEQQLPFLPDTGDDDAHPTFRPFVAAAGDLEAARSTGSHQARRRALQRADDRLAGFENRVAGERRPERLSRRLLPSARLWREVVADERAKLDRDEQERPQVPLVFVTGDALKPDDRELFKGRADIVQLLDHDLLSDRCAPLVLTGQRRVGKSSLLRMLPSMLGSGTTVVTANFQALSGSDLREQPFRAVAAQVHKALPETDSPPAGRWGATLDWLVSIDQELGGSDRRLLIAVDEVERVEDGIRKGWTDTDFLDFARAAGDTLRNARLLLVCARPIHLLGPHWADRLISAVSRRVGFLDEAEARELIVKPLPWFPDDVFPGEVAERIVRVTGRQPYLIQLVCDTLARRLNRDGRMQATSSDLGPALDEAMLTAGTLFTQLWNERSDDEHSVLRALANDQPSPDSLGPALHQLRQEDLVTPDPEAAIAVPLFSTWIRSNR